MSQPADLRSRVLAAVRQEPAPIRAEVRARTARLLILALGASLAVFSTAGGARIGERPSSLVILTSVGAAVLAGIAVYFAFTRGGSMLGRSRPLVGFVMVGCALGLFSWKYGVSAHYRGMTDRWPSRPGLKCFALAVAIGLFPLVGALVARRRSDALAPAATGAAFGAATALGAAMLVDLWCPVAYVPHLLLGHLLPVAVLSAVGAVGGRLLLSMRR